MDESLEKTNKTTELMSYNLTPNKYFKKLCQSGVKI
jgi:hypothetical protein